MLRPQNSFGSAQMAIVMAIGVPLVMLMFAAVRTRQLQSTANPRWAQFAKLTGPRQTTEKQGKVPPKASVRTASLSADEFSNSRSVGTTPSTGLTGSVTGHSSIELPVRSNVANSPPSIDPTPPDTEPKQNEFLVPTRKLILFRPVDEGRDPSQPEATVRLETQLQDVGRRLNRLAQGQEELVRQRREDAASIERRIRRLQQESQKKESMAALLQWLKEGNSHNQQDRLVPGEEAKRTAAPSNIARHSLPQAVARSADDHTPSKQEFPETANQEFVANTIPKMVQAAPAAEAQVPSATGAIEETIGLETAVAEAPRPSETIRIEPSHQSAGVFSMDVRNGDVREFFYKLSQTANVSILVGPEVSGSITLSLREVTLETALNALARSQGYVIEHEGNITQVSTIAEAARLKQQRRELMMRVYQPSFLSAAELMRLIVPLLSNDGRYSSTGTVNRSDVEQHRVDNQSEDETNGQQDAVIVQDVAEVHDHITQILVEMDVPPLQVEIEAQILCVRLPDTGPCGIDLRRLPCVPTTTGPNGSSTSELKQGTLACNVPAFVDSVSRLGDTQVVMTQRIQVLNKRRAEMLIGDRVGYQPCSGGSIQFLESGTRLVFRPSISADGWIKMDVEPEHHAIQWNKRTRAPRQHTTELSTHVLVPNGATIAIGGLITEQTIATTRRVPVVGAIPVVGSHFRRSQDRVQRSELIILVTPRIVTDCGSGTEAEVTGIRDVSSPKAAKGLQTLDRNKLARAHYVRATDHLQQGNMVKARQQIEASLRHNQQDANAQTLRRAIDESLTLQNVR